MKLRFVKPEDERLWEERADARLRTILAIVQMYLFVNHGIEELTITSFYRPQNPRSVHAYFRGVDFWTEDLPPGAGQAFRIVEPVDGGGPSAEDAVELGTYGVLSLRPDLVAARAFAEDLGPAFGIADLGRAQSGRARRPGER